MPRRFPTWPVLVLLCISACSPSATVGVSPAATTRPVSTATPIPAPLPALSLPVAPSGASSRPERLAGGHEGPPGTPG